ncbi:MAG: hypothetical protein AAGD22_10355 [Verrucomicrobiota bacterium]
MASRSANDESYSEFSHEEGPRSPVVRVLRVTDQGMVFESRRGFEVATFIDLGLHIPSYGRGGSAEPSFLCLEGFVVESVASLTGRTEGSSQVTILFSDLEAGDRELLCELGRQLAEEEAMRRPGLPEPSRLQSAEEDMVSQPWLN